MIEYLVIPITSNEVFNYFFTLVMANAMLAVGIQFVLRIVDRS